MRMRVHELHAAVVHAPLALLPTATAADLTALVTGDRGWARAGRALWVAGTLSALFAGVAGLAASQEVRAREPKPRDMMFLHGLGNALITTGAVAVTLWRLGHRPSLKQCLVGLGACGLAGYTATLGGKMVYDHGIGIATMPHDAPQGVSLTTPPLLSREAPRTLLQDALRGVRWLALRTRDVLTRREPLDPGAKGFELRPRAYEGPYTMVHGESRMPAPPSA